MSDRKNDPLVWLVGIAIIFIALLIVAILGWGFIEIIQWITSK